jgi:hypothetical protein
MCAGQGTPNQHPGLSLGHGRQASEPPYLRLPHWTTRESAVAPGAHSCIRGRKRASVCPARSRLPFVQRSSSITHGAGYRSRVRSRRARPCHRLGIGKAIVARLCAAGLDSRRPWMVRSSWCFSIGRGALFGGHRQAPGSVRSNSARRSGSTSASIWVIFPLVTVNAITENSRPRGATTAPAAPLTSAGHTNG